MKVQVTNYKVNEKGLNEIKEFLASNHKLGANFTRDMLHAWAAEAETNADDGNLPTIEIKPWDSIHGYAQEYQISDSGIDAETIEIDE